MKFIEYWSILFFCTDAFFSAHNLETEILYLLLKAILRTLMIYILKSSNLNKLLFFFMFQNVRKKIYIYIYFTVQTYSLTWKVLVTQSCWTLYNPMDKRSLKGYYSTSGSSCPWHSPGRITGVGSHSFSKASSWPMDKTQVSCIAGR